LTYEKVRNRNIIINNSRRGAKTAPEQDVAADDAYAMFLYALNSPVTRERYSTRLRYFFSKIGLEGKTMEELCRLFVKKGKQEPEWVVRNTNLGILERTRQNTA
jgi:hypothetical protein